MGDCVSTREDTQSLVNEVSGIEKVLQDAQAILEKRSSHKQLPQDGIAAGMAIVLATKAQLTKLDNLLESCVKERATDEHKIRLAWIA